MPDHTDFHTVVHAVEDLTENVVSSSALVPIGNDREVFISHLLLDNREYVLTLAPTALGPVRAREAITPPDDTVVITDPEEAEAFREERAKAREEGNRKVEEARAEREDQG